MERPLTPRRVFISYSRDDEALLTELLKHLANMVKGGWLEHWTDRLFVPGETWEPVLENRLRTADVILLLVSASFNASEFIQTRELTTALERHERGEARIVPILLRPADLRDHALSKFQTLPLDRKAITLWDNRDSAWLDVINGLYKALEQPLPHEKPLHASRVSGYSLPTRPTYDTANMGKTGEILEGLRTNLLDLERRRVNPEEQLELKATMSKLKRELREGPELKAGMWVDERYELLSFLGRGNFALVWMARDELSERLVALKLLKEEAWSHATSQQRLASGLRAMQSASHPHILRVLEPWSTETGPGKEHARLHYGVLELAEGGDFRRYVESKKPAPGEVLRIVLEIASALEYAHERGCIHRDVKPANILLMADGTAKLTDFDLARVGDSTHGTVGAVGTMYFIAPEALETPGAQPRPCWDVFALGVTLLSGLTGQSAPRRPERLVSSDRVPQEFRALLTQAIAEDAERRYQTMSELQRALEAAIDQHIEGRLQEAKEAKAQASIKDVSERLKSLTLEFSWLARWLPKLLEPWLHWIARAEAQEHFDEALELVQAASEVQPEARDWKAERARIEGLRTLETDYREALKLLKKGQAAKAAPLLQEVLRRSPDYKDARKQLFIALAGVDPELLREQIVRLEGEVGRLEAQLQAVSLENEGQKSQLQSERAEQKKQLEARRQELVRLEGQLDQLKRELGERDKVVMRHKDELEAGKREQATLEAELKAVSESRAADRKINTELRRELEQSRGRATALEAELAPARSELKNHLKVTKDLLASKQALVDARSQNRWLWGAAIGLAGVTAVSFLMPRGTSPVEPASTPVAAEVNPAPPAPATPAPAQKAGDETLVTLPGTTLKVAFKYIPPGSFKMGSNDGASDEKPIHPVTLSGFQISKTEVTVAQYRACVNAAACTEPSWDDEKCRVWNGSTWKEGKLPESFRRDDQPIVCVDHAQATAFAEWVGGRLPTEAEWEYAARGSNNRKYPWGDTPEPSCELATHDPTGSVGSGCGKDSTWPVCSKEAGNTPEGLCDMAGNVWEWVADCWHDSYDDAPQSGSAWTTACEDADRKSDPSGSLRVLRGGSWSSDPGGLRGANRSWNGSGNRGDNVGFRVVAVSRGPDL